jgi:predicted Zn finger-like uncharacterized protein
MRLICPNCGAQYEVAGDVIPTGGRDVQCLSCGHDWFRLAGASVTAELGAETLRGAVLSQGKHLEPEPEPEPKPKQNRSRPRPDRPRTGPVHYINRVKWPSDVKVITS